MKLPFKKSSERNSKPSSGWKSTVIMIVSAPVLALLLTAHVFQSYQVDGQSMETTLQNADRLIVNKLSKTIANLRNNSYIPNRYDIVVFDRPVQSNISGDVDHLIKRVIALPGERVLVRNGRVTVFNQQTPNGFDPDVNQSYSEAVSNTSGQVDITVGANEIFVLGDNRSNSTDSRKFGSIPSSILVGTAEVRFAPINNTKSL